jgi:hypothetical protein
MSSLAGWNFLGWTVLLFFSFGLLFTTFAAQTVTLPSPWLGYGLVVWTLLTLAGFVQSGLDLRSDMQERGYERRGRLGL